MFGKMLTIKNNLLNGFNTNTLNILYLIAIIFSILVIISKNPIISIIFLIGLFSSISLYFILLNLTFIGLSYLIVYIGAVSILFIFILMLINIRLSELHSNTNNSIPLSMFITVLGLIQLMTILPYKSSKYISINSCLNSDLINLNYLYNNIDIINNKLLYVLVNSWDGNIGSISHITAIGNIMYTSHNIWVIIISNILLLTMIGTIIITIRQVNKKRN
jgi:NADH-ubiquinone oxidoreductase chain 6